MPNIDRTDSAAPAQDEPQFAVLLRQRALLRDTEHTLRLLLQAGDETAAQVLVAECAAIERCIRVGAEQIDLCPDLWSDLSWSAS